MVRRTHDYSYRYRGYWADGGRRLIRLYREDGCPNTAVCWQLPDNGNTSITNMAEYLAAEVVEEHRLPTPLTWVEHYPENRGRLGEWSLVSFSSWDLRDDHLGGVVRRRVGRPRWSPLTLTGVARITGGDRRPARTLGARGRGGGGS